MMTATKIDRCGALHIVKMLLSNTAVPTFGNSHERQTCSGRGGGNAGGNRAQRLSQSGTGGDYADRRVGLSVVAGVVS